MTTIGLEQEIPYPLLALRDLISESPAVVSRTVDRIHVGELPDSESKSMPRAAVILTPTGGPFSTTYVPLSRQRFDLRCYGQTPLEAMRVYLAVHAVLKFVTRTVRLNCLIHDVTLESAPLALRDNEVGAEWPMVWSTYSVLASEVSLAAAT